MTTRPPVEWDDDPGPRLDAIRHVAAGAAVGVGFCLAAGVLVFAWRSLRAGAYDRLLAFALALVLLPLTGRALLGIAAVETPTDTSLRRRPLLVAGGAWALGLAVTVRWRPLATLGLLVAAGVLWFAVAATGTSGRIDSKTVTYGSRTFSLAGLDGVRRIPLGPVAVYWLDFERGSVGSGVPRTLVVPRRVDGDVRAFLDRAAAVETEIDTEASAGVGTAERAVAATLGLGFLLAGPTAWLLLPAGSDATLVTGYLTLFGLPFAVVLLRYALVA